MRLILFVTTLMVGTAALAQTQPAPTPPGGNDTTMPSSGTTNPQAGTTNDGMMPAPQALSTMPSQQQPMNSDSVAPAQPPMSPSPRDSAPSSASQSGMAPMAAPSTGAAPMAQASYPRCSATVTDQCRQGASRERDTRRRRR
jgi:hypothetical protein